MTYDGHGRMKTRHYPIEDAATDTTWIYNSDDSIQQIIDPRGAITNFTYEAQRGLLTQISYDPPANPPTYTTIPDTPNANFAYDALGNRTSMSDGTGTTAYIYDELSRLTSETKTFTGLTGSFTIGYSYNLSGGLKSITDPFNSAVNYTNDKTGRLTKVEGTPWGDNTDGKYVDGIEYRAFGAVKQLRLKTTDNNLVAMQYDNRLRVGSHQTSSAQSNAVGGFVQKAAFAYLPDSRPQAMDNQVNDKFDRTFGFDFAGRLTRNEFGDWQSGTVPYSQAVSYDAFSQMASRGTTHWGSNNSFAAVFTNGRQVSPGGSVYDAAGNMIRTHTRSSGENQSTIYDAANRSTTVTTRSQEFAGYTHKQILVQDFDGDGRAVKSQETWQTGSQPPLGTVTKYQMWSSVLNSPLTEISGTETKLTTKVFAGGAVIAEQLVLWADLVQWISADPVTGSSVRISKNGAFHDIDRKELEPLGQEVLPQEPPQQQPPPSAENVTFSAQEPEWQCQVATDMGKEFFEKPVHCQKAQIENALRYSDLFSSKTEENPNRIAAGGSPGATEQTAGDRPLNLTATDKPHSSGGGAAGSPASIPSADGYDPYDTDVENTPEQQIIRGRGKEVNGLGDSIPGFIDASQSGQDHKGGIKIEHPEREIFTPREEVANPNCIMNAVQNSKGLARPFGNVNTNKNSPGYNSIGHDGVHVVADEGSIVTTLPALTGKVIDIRNGGDGTLIVNVLLDGGNIAIYKDLKSVNVKPKQRLKAGAQIGKVGITKESAGLHFTLLKGGLAEYKIL